MALRLDAARFASALALAAAAALLGVLAGVNPRAAIALSLGFAFVLIAFADLSAGLAVFGFLSFVELVPLGGGPVLSATKLIGLLLALSWLAAITTRTETHNDFISAHPVMTMVLALFLAWSLLSLVWAESTSEALGATGRYALNVILFLVVFTAVRTRSQAKFVVGGFLAGAGVAALYGLVTTPSNPDIDPTRLGSEVLDPNELASVLIAGGALAAGVVAAYRTSPLVRACALAAGAFCVVAILLTASRGGLIALGVALVVAVIVSGRWRIPVAAAAVLVSGAAILYFTSLAPESVRERISETSKGQERVLEGRTTIWKIGWRAVEDKPVQGVGSGNFQTSSRHYLLQPGAVTRSDEIISEPAVTHNTYLHVLSELGIVGLGLLLTVIAFAVGSTFRAARRFARRRDVAMEALSLAVIVAIAGTLAADFFLSQQYSKQLWLLLGLGPALYSISTRSGSATGDSPLAAASQSSS